MPFFIICNLAAAALSYVKSPYLPLLIDDTLVAGMVSISLAWLLAGCFRWVTSAVWLDGVACAGLWILYGYWPPEFSEGAPMFIAIPLYFSALTAWLHWTLVSRAPRFDENTRQTVRQLQGLIRFDTPWLAGLMLISLAFPEHYLSYPLLTTLFIVRSTLQLCFEAVRDAR